MDRTFDLSLREHLSLIFTNSETVSEFRHWFSRAWWDAESSAPPELDAVAARIDTFTYILDQGVWDEAEFIEHLRDEAKAWFPNMFGVIDLVFPAPTPSLVVQVIRSSSDDASPLASQGRLKSQWHLRTSQRHQGPGARPLRFAEARL